MHDNFSIALGMEDMAQSLQLGNELLKVVDLAIENDDHRAVFVEQRLLPGRDIDDRKPPMAQSQARLEMHIALVRPTMRQRLCHSTHHPFVDGAFAAGVKEASDSAHGSRRVLGLPSCDARKQSSIVFELLCACASAYQRIGLGMTSGTDCLHYRDGIDLAAIAAL